ncbi:TetR/AcrR family transcriptional regulator [Streptomyces violaceusniger]
MPTPHPQRPIGSRAASEPRARSTGQRRRRTGGGLVLSQDVIVDTALALIAGRGPESLTARVLGAELGADPSAIYRYFAGMDDLWLAIADRLISTSLDAWQPQDDWLADLASLGRAFYQVYVVEYPQAGRVAAARVTRRPNEFRVIEAVLEILRTAGFDRETAVDRLWVLTDFVLAYAALDAGFACLPDQARTGDDHAWEHEYAQAAAHTHPNIAATTHLLIRRMSTSSFEAAQTLLLEGLRHSPRTTVA